MGLRTGPGGLGQGEGSEGGGEGGGGVWDRWGRRPGVGVVVPRCYVGFAFVPPFYLPSWSHGNGPPLFCDHRSGCSQLYIVLFFCRAVFFFGDSPGRPVAAPALRKHHVECSRMTPGCGRGRVGNDPAVIARSFLHESRGGGLHIARMCELSHFCA